MGGGFFYWRTPVIRTTNEPDEVKAARREYEWLLAMAHGKDSARGLRGDDYWLRPRNRRHRPVDKTIFPLGDLR